MAKQSMTATSMTANIDYPREGEPVKFGHYAIRISGVPDRHRVEASINAGEWQACRFAAGYYWLDWMPNKPGKAKLAARFMTNKGTWKESSELTCNVVAAKEKESNGTKDQFLRTANWVGGVLRRNN